MAEYIEREAAIAEIRRAAAWADGINVACEMVDELPAADVVEVVRCRDCINRNHYCDCPATESDCVGMYDNDFCSKGVHYSTLNGGDDHAAD